MYFLIDRYFISMHHKAVLYRCYIAWISVLKTVFKEFISVCTWITCCCCELACLYADELLQNSFLPYNSTLCKIFSTLKKFISFCYFIVSWIHILQLFILKWNQQIKTNITINTGIVQQLIQHKHVKKEAYTIAL